MSATILTGTPRVKPIRATPIASTPVAFAEHGPGGSHE